MLDDLNEFIQSNPDPRELKRAIAVEMFMQGYKHREIQEILSRQFRLYQQMDTFV